MLQRAAVEPHGDKVIRVRLILKTHGFRRGLAHVRLADAVEPPRHTTKHWHTALPRWFRARIRGESVFGQKSGEKDPDEHLEVIAIRRR